MLLMFFFGGFLLGTICAFVPCLNYGVSWLLHLHAVQVSSFAVIIFGKCDCVPPAFPEQCGCFPSLFAYHVFGPLRTMTRRALFTRQSNLVQNQTPWWKDMKSKYVSYKFRTHQK
jgi:hypothetical protein